MENNNIIALCDKYGVEHFREETINIWEYDCDNYYEWDNDDDYEDNYSINKNPIYTCLMWSIYKNNFDAVKKIINDMPSIVNKPN